ncbi:hypothetical protein [Neorhizobium tomejilense]|uniref:hypothetical protein n=1 Tax=Neorhizobium tomejilense TaxID=2093828 RepID=UPI003ECC4AF4
MRSCQVAFLWGILVSSAGAAEDYAYQFELINELHTLDTVRILAAPIGMLRGSVGDNRRGQCPAVIIENDTILTVCQFSMSKPEPIPADQQGGGSFMFGTVREETSPYWTKVSFQNDTWGGVRLSLDAQVYGKKVSKQYPNLFMHKVDKKASAQFGQVYVVKKPPRAGEEIFIIRATENKFVRRDCRVDHADDDRFKVQCANGAFQPRSDFIFSKDSGSLLGIAPVSGGEDTEISLLQSYLDWSTAWRPSKYFYRMTESGNAEAVVDRAVSEKVCVNRTAAGSFLTKSLQELVESKEAKSIGIAICTYYSGQPVACKRTADEAARVSNEITRNEGSDTNGFFHAPAGYELCKAHLVMGDMSVTSETSYSGTIVREADRSGLDYYISMPVGTGERHWINARYQLEFVIKGRAWQHNCWPHKTVAWSCKGPTNCPVLHSQAKLNGPVKEGICSAR